LLTCPNIMDIATLIDTRTPTSSIDPVAGETKA
jgi:hypothetical protein